MRLRLRDQIHRCPLFTNLEHPHEYVVRNKERLEQASDELKWQQWQIRHQDKEKLPLFIKGEMVWLENQRRRLESNPGLQL